MAIRFDNSVCFATLALGARHVFHACQLAADLERFAPNSVLIVLSDNPSAFKECANVIASRHRQQSPFRCFHDKRFLINTAFEHAETCIVIDANIRVLAPLLPEHTASLETGINAAHLYTIESKWISDEQPDESIPPSLKREKAVVNRVLASLDLTAAKVRFPQEYLYAIKRSNNNDQIQSWLEAWGYLANYFDFHRLPWSEGFGIGIAAAAVGLPLECVRVIPDSGYYKERTHRFNLKTFRNPVSEAQEHCHAQQELIKNTFFAPPTRLKKIAIRLGQAFRYTLLRIRNRTDDKSLADLKALPSKK